MTAFLSFLQRSAFKRFRDGRPGPWGALAASIFGFRMLLRWSKRTEEVVYRSVIEPGEGLTITHLTESTFGRVLGGEEAGEAGPPQGAPRRTGHDHGCLSDRNG